MCAKSPSPPPDNAKIHEYVIAKGKDVIAKMHGYASYLMSTYGEQYVFDEINDEMGVNIRFRTFRFATELTYGRHVDMEVPLGQSCRLCG